MSEIYALFYDIGIIVLAAALCGLLAHRLRQPLILGYLLAGLLIGPSVLQLVTDHATITLLSEMGIIFLLFTVGLELDIRKVRNLGFAAIVAGLGQVLFTSVVSYILLQWMGMGHDAALILSIALTLSSTVIVVKLLSDRNEINTLHGRIALGILIVQDFIAVVVIALLSGGGDFSAGTLLLLALKGAVLCMATVALGLTILPFLFRFVARSQELLLISAVAWCLVVALGSYALNFSPAIGALLAGVSLASLPYRFEITARVRILRDFFAMIFFASLGLQLELLVAANQLWQMLGISLFVLIGNPLLVLLLLAFGGFKPRTSFLTGVLIAQVSEFSLIIVELAHKQAIVSQADMSLIVMVLAVTFAGSTYMITHGETIFNTLEPLLRWTSRLALRKQKLEYVPEKYAPQVILIGAKRIGSSVIDKAKELGLRLFVVDFNPELIARMMRAKIPCVYGDAGDLDVFRNLNLRKAIAVISTSISVESNLRLLRMFKSYRKTMPFIAVAEHPAEGMQLYNEGADGVILPHLLGGGRASGLLLKAMRKKGKLSAARRKHLLEIKRWLGEMYGDII